MVANFAIQVYPTYIPGANITFCGESPGYYEVRDGQGFVGFSGKVLWRMAASAGINPEKVNRTNVAKRRPPGDNFGIFYHDPRERKHPTEELIFWQEVLLRELEKYRPNVFVAAGDEALKTLVPSIRVKQSEMSSDKKDKSAIGKYRGSVLFSEVIPGLKVIPIRHPAWITRMNWQWYYIGKRDMKRIAVESVSPDRVEEEPTPNFVTAPTIGQAIGFIDYITEHPEVPWNIDIETRGDTITCFGLSTDDWPNHAICVPVQTTKGPYWSVEEEMAMWRALGKAFQTNPLCYNQNLAYDIDYMLDPYRCEPSGFYFDSMIGHKFLYPEFDKGLDLTCSVYTHVEYYKDDGKTWKKRTPDPKLWEYCAKDVWVTPKVTHAIITDMQQQKQWENYNKRSNRFIPIALEMQRNRLKINQEWYDRMKGILHDERTARQKDLEDELGGEYHEVNVRSAPQIRKIMYEDLRLPEKKKRGNQTLSTEEPIIKELRATVAKDSRAFKVLDLMLSVRHLRTREANYFNVTLDPDGHWPFTVMVGNDKTGRWESKKSPKWRGTKVGHIPKVVRLMFEPPEGKIFVQRDLSQAEARYVGAEARCNFLNNTFADFDAGRGEKIHKVVGKMLWGEVPKQDSIEYDAAKSIVHAYDYMESPKRLAIEANLSLQEGQRVYKTYGQLVPEVTAWQQRIKDEATRIGYLTTPTGRIRQCYSACAMVTNTGQLADEIWRDLVSWKPQSTIPDILNEGMFQTWENLGEWVFMHQQGHDSHLDSIPPGRLEEYFDKTEVYHRVPILVDKEIELVIPSELCWGYLWGALKPYQPGDKGTREEWLAWAEEEGIFEIEGKGKIKERLYAKF